MVIRLFGIAHGIDENADRALTPLTQKDPDLRAHLLEKLHTPLADAVEIDCVRSSNFANFALTEGPWRGFLT